MLTFTEIFTGALCVGAIALVAGAFQAARDKRLRHLGGPFAMAIVGGSFMLSAGVVALAELEDSEQLIPVRTLRLPDSREEMDTDA
ncbi:hypothetical protein ACLQ2R_00725 [Streptosporangium sp. DT93]|uniref:hypothetical protein n=1 Tax=Streptosporangium sp. DT93 TaxID=3393428 RepID=UPI003CF00CE7